MTVDQGNPRLLMAQPRRACHAAKACADDDDMRCALVGWERTMRPINDQTIERMAPRAEYPEHGQ